MQKLKVTSWLNSATKMEADSSFDLLHISFNLSACVQTGHQKEEDYFYLFAVLTDTVAYSHQALP